MTKNYLDVNSEKLKPNRFYLSTSDLRGYNLFFTDFNGVPRDKNGKAAKLSEYSFRSIKDPVNYLVHLGIDSKDAKEAKNFIRSCLEEIVVRFDIKSNKAKSIFLRGFFSK